MSEVDLLAARVAALESEHSTTTETIATNQSELNAFYLMWAGALIFLMQAGFATLSAGSIRAKNVKNILLKNLLDACIGAIAWYLVGFGFAYDGNACSGADCDLPGAHRANPFIGSSGYGFALSGVEDKHDGVHAHGYDWITWFFQYAFAAAAATIVSGAVAERCQLQAYLIYSFGITGFVYPVVVHWVWDGNGFLSAFNKDHVLGGVIDFAGSGVVHMTGGWAALVGAAILGPRLGRFENPAAFEGHSTPLQIIGTFLLWFGWYGFNPGSTLYVHGYARDMARSAVTTTLSAASGGLAGLYLKKSLPEKLGGSGNYDVGHTCNSLLGGLVGITAGCVVVDPWAAIIIGMFSAVVYHAASCLMRRLRIDDPLDAFAVHGACGLWGLIAVGLFTVREYSYAPHAENHKRFDGDGNDLGPDSGIFMPHSRGILFATQVVFALLEILWVCTLSCLIFGTMKLLGIFRVSQEEEDAGADISKHGGAAYVVEGAAPAAKYVANGHAQTGKAPKITPDLPPTN